MFSIIRIIIIFILLISNANSSMLKECKWDNKDGIPCITISKTTNTSTYSSIGVNKLIINKEYIEQSNAKDITDILDLISGFSVYQDGPKGQKTSIFTRGSESNHTLVLLNGIAINDQSVTDGLHDFGQDFLQTIQQIEIYKGPSGAHFGPGAIAGAINIVTDIDYKNATTVGGYNGKNNSASVNYTKITQNNWHLNFKSSTLQSKTNSAKAEGSETDGTKNYQTNINIKKWINDNLKFKSSIYSRKTQSDYDSSATNEHGYNVDNKMYSLQAGLENVSKNKEDSIIFHYHIYDRNYKDGGFLDEFESQSLVSKIERKVRSTNRISYGFGSEYKYDWGEFQNRGSFIQSTKGHIKDMGFFANMGFKFSENSIFSLYGRSDDHNTTGGNQTYKLNYNHKIDKFKFGATHSTGLRNPTLYELYGSNNYGYKGHSGLNPEKSTTNELTGIYNFSDSLNLNLAVYKTTIYDRLEDNGSFTATENKKNDLNQEGLETEILFKGTNQSFSIFNNFLKSKNTNGQAQLRRPDLTYGSNYRKSFLSYYFGPFDLNVNYKFTAKHTDTNDNGDRIKMKNTDIVNISFLKNISGNIFSINISNLFNERYERPATYSKDGRQIMFGFKQNY